MEEEQQVSEQDPEEPEQGEASTPPLDEQQIQIQQRILQFLNEKWGQVPPPCPYCRIAAWAVDPFPVILQRHGQISGFGVPVFLVWCTNCGNELHMSVAAVGLWEEVMGSPLPPDALPTPVGTEASEES